MIKLVYCITKRPDLTDAEFFDYWQNIHGPIGARIPGLRRLIQSHALVGRPELQPDFHGTAELWFDDFDALLAARRSPEWQASTADEANFIDRPGWRSLSRTNTRLWSGFDEHARRCYTSRTPVQFLRRRIAATECVKRRFILQK
jgi:uncharacterized protein (TIGR02118 family)